MWVRMVQGLAAIRVTSAGKTNQVSTLLLKYSFPAVLSANFAMKIALIKKRITKRIRWMATKMISELF
jgi:hypothetical protein